MRVKTLTTWVVWPVAVPKLVLRNINSVGRTPDGLCPTTVASIGQATKSTLSVVASAGNRSTATAGSGVDVEYQLHGISTTILPPTLPSDYGRYFVSATVSYELFTYCAKHGNLSLQSGQFLFLADFIYVSCIPSYFNNIDNDNNNDDDNNVRIKRTEGINSK